MATSKANLEEAQSPCLCQLCENNTEIRWKCQECCLLMCEKCKTKVHSKFREADGHTVIKTEDITTNEFLQPNLHILCDNHTEERICLFCKKCDQLVCPICVSNQHKDHNFENLAVLYGEKLKSLNYFRNEVNFGMSCYAAYEKNVEEKLKSQELSYDDIKKSILEQEEILKKAIEMKSKSLIQILESSREDARESASIKLSENSSAQKDVGLKLKYLDALLKSGNFRKIIDAELFIKSSCIDINNAPYLFNQEPDFFEYRPIKDKSQLNISELFGTLEKVPTDRNIQINILDSCKVNNQHIGCLCPYTKDSILVNENEALNLKEISFRDNIIQIQNEQNVAKQILDTAFIEDDYIVLSFLEDPHIKILAADRKFENVVDFSPLLPRALHFTQSGYLLVGVREVGPLFPLSSKSVRKLLVLEKNGRKLHEFEFDTQRKRMFTYIRNVISVNNDICVIDLTGTSDEVGRVIGLAYPNKILWKYGGKVDTSYKLDFKPKSISTSPMGHIIVLDSGNEVFHLLNTKGVLQMSIRLRNCGIERPFSFCIDFRGRMWISSKEPYLRIFHERSNIVSVASFSGF